MEFMDEHECQFLNEMNGLMEEMEESFSNWNFIYFDILTMQNLFGYLCPYLGVFSAMAPPV